MTEVQKSDEGTLRSIHPETRIGHISLTVNNLENQIRFYKETLGFNLHWQDDHTAGMGAGGEDLLRMIEDPKAKRYPEVTGLYHFAVLYPNRRELARAIARLFSLKIPNSPTDHIMTKSTYLNDPEGNGIELYTESPEDGEWFMNEDKFFARRSDGSLSNGREPLDLQELFSHLQPEDPFNTPSLSDTKIGHVHLHIRDLDEAVDFYHNLIGFDVMGIARNMRAAFVSAGSYHHHLGLNTWQGIGAPAPPGDAIGLRYFSIVLPNQAELDWIQARIQRAGIHTEIFNDSIFLHDPSQNGLLLAVKSA